MGHPELLLSNQVCFLFHRIDRAIVAKYQPLLQALGLTYPQYLAMLVLWEKKSVTVGELCTDLSLDTGTVSPLLKRLQGVGLVERRRGEGGDERVVRVSLTKVGAEMEERAKGIPGALAACVFETAEEYRTLKPLLDVLADRLDGTCGDRRHMAPGPGFRMPGR
jgi:MarR family transcriptional regulator, organic hydroperoxide resistance regulator